jgi:hypothetical protein
VSLRTNRTETQVAVKTIKVLPTDDTTVEILASSIVAISEGIRKLRAGPLNEKALVLLIQHAAPTTGYNGTRPGVQEIRAVLDGMESLEKQYLKPRKEKSTRG